MSIDEQPMNVYWSGKRTETSNNFKTNYKGSVATKSNLPNLGNKTGDMYNVTESGENFIWNDNSWDSLSGDTLKTLNWQKSEKANTVAIYPVSETMLYPVVEFVFTETDPAEGDKSSSNPSAITGVESVKVIRYKKNLCPITFGRKNYDDIAVSVNADGSFTFNGTARAGTIFYVDIYHEFQATADRGFILKRGITYTASMTGDSGIVFSLYKTISTTTDSGYGNPIIQVTAGEVSTATIPSATTGLFFRLSVPAGTTVNNATIKIQIEEGTVATSFEPYEENNYTIDFNGTYYGGNIDLATGLMTVTHVAVAPEESTVDISSAPAALPLDYADTYGRTITSADGTSLVVGSIGGMVVYKLAVPQIVQLSPVQIFSFAQADKYMPRLNTIYTNASSIQIGYAKSPIRSEYELTQAIAAVEGSE